MYRNFRALNAVLGRPNCISKDVQRAKLSNRGRVTEAEHEE